MRHEYEDIALVRTACRGRAQPAKNQVVLLLSKYIHDQVNI